MKILIELSYSFDDLFGYGHITLAWADHQNPSSRYAQTITYAGPWGGSARAVWQATAQKYQQIMDPKTPVALDV